MNSPPVGGRALCIDAGWDSQAAADSVAQLGYQVGGVAIREDVLRGPLRLARLAREARADFAVLTTRDWDRQVVPQICEFSLLAMKVPCFRFDRKVGEFTRLTRAHLLGRAVLMPFAAASGLVRSAWTAWRSSRPSRRKPTFEAVVGPGSGVLVIWLIREELQVGGGISHIAGILSGMKAAGLRVALVARAHPPKQLDGLYDDIEVLDALPAQLRCLPFTELIGLNSQVCVSAERLAKRFKVDCVYERHAPYLVAGSDVAERLGVPLVLEVNGPEVWSRLNWASRVPGEQVFLPFAREMEKRALNSAALVAPVSTNAAKAAIEECGAKPHKVLVSPNAVNVEAVERTINGIEPRADGKVWVGWVGSFGPWHGAPVLVEALAQLPGNVSALLIGSGAERGECLELAESLGVSERVEMPGSLPHDEALKALAACHILASPHVPTGDQPFFGSPTKLFDFMAIGRPTVASDLEQIGELLDDGETAILTVPGDVSSLVEGLTKMLDLPDLGQSIGRAARERARELHTWERRVQDILDALSGDQPNVANGKPH